jgi:hypothetical protein
MYICVEIICLFAHYHSFKVILIFKLLSVSEQLSWNSPDHLPGYKYLFPAAYKIYFFDTSLITIRLQSFTAFVIVNK